MTVHTCLFTLYIVIVHVCISNYNVFNWYNVFKNKISSASTYDSYSRKFTS